MKNDTAIFLTGFARGGTNIAWNLVQSHPDVTTPIDEIGQLRRRSLLFRLALDNAPKSDFCRKQAIRMLKRYQMNTLRDVDNKYKHENVEYSESEVG